MLKLFYSQLMSHTFIIELMTYQVSLFYQLLYLPYFAVFNSIFLKTVQLAGKFKRKMAEKSNFKIHNTIQIRRETVEKVQKKCLNKFKKHILYKMKQKSYSWI